MALKSRVNKIHHKLISLSDNNLDHVYATLPADLSHEKGKIEMTYLCSVRNGKTEFLKEYAGSKFYTPEEHKELEFKKSFKLGERLEF